MKTLEFIYQDTAIQFLVNPDAEHVMVNATEMAKVFGKETRVYLKTKSTKEFISALERSVNSPVLDSEQALIGARSGIKIIDNRGHMGIYFDRRLALDFAAWLDVDFRVWVFSTIDKLLFGHYKEHWKAHARQEKAKLEMESIKKELFTNPTPDLVAAYFEQEREFIASKNAKTTAIRNQLKLFEL